MGIRLYSLSPRRVGKPLLSRQRRLVERCRGLIGPVGSRNKDTIERGFRLEQVREELIRREGETQVDPFSIFNELFLAALKGDVRAAGLYLAYRFGKPKETVGLEGGAILNPLDGRFRCFLSDGRSLPAGPLPLPGSRPPRD